MSMTKQQQVAYVANIAFADELGRAADSAYVRDVTEVHPDDQKVYDKLSKDDFLRPQSHMEYDSLQYKMQADFVDFAKKLLAKVEGNPHWDFLMAVASGKGQREALYLLYMTAVGSGVGFGDHEWDDLGVDVTDAPREDLDSWADHFANHRLLGYPDTPSVSWPLRNARPHRREP